LRKSSGVTEHLTWLWLGMIPRSGAASPVSVRGLRIDSRFIPVVILSAGRYEPRAYFLDVVKSETKDKGLKVEHPWEQPVGPFLKLVEAFSKSGELVLDPLCGTARQVLQRCSLGDGSSAWTRTRRLCRLQSKGCQRAEPAQDSRDRGDVGDKLSHVVAATVIRASPVRL